MPNDEVKFLFKNSGYDFNELLKFEAVHCQPQSGFRYRSIVYNDQI